jgi:hypothetical protein
MIARLAAAWRALPSRLRRGADRLGRPGLIGAAIFATCAGYYAGSIHPLARQIDELRANALRAPHVAPPAPDPAEPLLRFAAGFPEERELARALARLYALGEREGLRLSQAEYRHGDPDVLGIVQHRIALPVGGSYPQIRQFIAALLEELPGVAVTQLTLQRERIGQARIDARLELTLYVRAGDARVAQQAPAATPQAAAPAAEVVR